MPIVPIAVTPVPIADPTPAELIPEVLDPGPGIPELGEPPVKPPPPRERPPPPPPPPGNPRPFTCGPTGMKCDARDRYCLHSGVIGGVRPPDGVHYDPTSWSCTALPAGCADCSCMFRALGASSMGALGCDGDGWTGMTVTNIGYAP